MSGRNLLKHVPGCLLAAFRRKLHFKNWESNRKGHFLDLSQQTYRMKSCKMGRFGADVDSATPLLQISRGSPAAKEEVLLRWYEKCPHDSIILGVHRPLVRVQF